jgi:hypothetical protein
MSDTIKLTRAELQQIQAAMALVAKKLHSEDAAGVSTPAPRKGRRASKNDLDAAVAKHLKKYSRK